jgi:hypothetical protein
MTNPTVQITLTMEELRGIIREEIARAQQPGASEAITEEVDEIARYGDLSDFPVDSYGSWDESLFIRREDMYGDEGR